MIMKNKQKYWGKCWENIITLQSAEDLGANIATTKIKNITAHIPAKLF